MHYFLEQLKSPLFNFFKKLPIIQKYYSQIFGPGLGHSILYKIIILITTNWSILLIYQFDGRRGRQCCQGNGVFEPDDGWGWLSNGRAVESGASQGEEHQHTNGSWENHGRRRTNSSWNKPTTIMLSFRLRIVKFYCVHNIMVINFISTYVTVARLFFTQNLISSATTDLFCWWGSLEWLPLTHWLGWCPGHCQPCKCKTQYPQNQPP